MIDRIYYRFHKLFSKSEEKGKYSAGYWQGKVREASLKLCQNYTGRILEVGCGEGLFLFPLAIRNPGLETFGVDNNNQRLSQAEEKAKERNIQNIKLSLQEAISLNFKDEYFDAVLCINTIFNLESIEIVKKVLCDMARVCKKNGRVIFDFRNSANPYIYLKYKLAPFYDRTVKDLPLKSYELKQIRLVLNEAGLRIINKIGIGFSIKSMAPVVILETEKI